MEKNASEFKRKFIRSYYQDSHKKYILKVDVKYPKGFHNFHSNLPFLPERMKM